MAHENYTLVIPTYNRAESLARLLRYVASDQIDFRVRVLDSSRPEVREANRKTIAALPISCDYIEFPETTHPFDKFRQGVNGVTTPLCGLCADDDVLIIEGLNASIKFLLENKEYSVAHGYYFQFSFSIPQIDIENITYYTPSYAAADPLDRLHSLMRHYQALTYGTYRTEVLSRIFDLIQPVKSILGRELLSSALAAVHGKVARLPVIFHGRNLGPSSSYTNWHPLEWLIRDPSGLFGDYVLYRDIILGEILRFSSNGRDLEDAKKIIDLIHTQYFVRHAPDGCFDYMISEALRGTDPAAIFGSPIVTHGLIQAASEFQALEGDGIRPQATSIFGSRGAALPVLSGAEVGRIRRYSDRLGTYLDHHAPAFAARLRRAKRALGAYRVPRALATRPPSSAGEAASIEVRPQHVNTDRRSYVMAPAFLQPDPAFGVDLEPGATDRLLSALDRYH